MKERPILFSAPMIRALLDGRKTMTRRVVKLNNLRDCVWCEGKEPYEWQECGELSGYDYRQPCRCITHNCPYGQPGDRLWVKETLWIDVREPNDCVIYAANPELHKYRNSDMVQSCDPGISTEYLEKHEFWKRKPSIFMPRWASRITLELTAVRVERVQDISHRDALAEGVAYDLSMEDGAPIPRYRKLWDSLNSKRGFGWDKNPWVWVLTFKRIKPAKQPRDTEAL